MTASMRHGVACEPIAADAYVEVRLTSCKCMYKTNYMHFKMWNIFQMSPLKCIKVHSLLACIMQEPV